MPIDHVVTEFHETRRNEKYQESMDRMVERDREEHARAAEEDGFFDFLDEFLDD